MSTYRKNKTWGTHSFEINKSNKIDKEIQNNIKLIEKDIEKQPSEYLLDIIDISIRSIYIPETRYDISSEIHYITIMYAIVNEKGQKVII